MNVDVLRYAAFTDNPGSGNPAGVVVEAGQLTEPDMLGIAAEVGYSETAFVTGADRSAAGMRCGTSARAPRCRSAGTPPSPPR